MKHKMIITNGASVFAVLLVIDFITTLFAIKESGLYSTKLGIDINMVIAPDSMDTVFSLTPKIVYSLIAFVGLAYLIALLWKYVFSK